MRFKKADDSALTTSLELYWKINFLSFFFLHSFLDIKNTF
jgi:hypothetical protein